MKPLLSRLLLPIYVGAETPTATLDSGPIFGLTTSLPAASPVNKFLGIPYAAKPQRFSRATKPEPWTKPLNATIFGPSCRQLFVQSELTPEIDLLKGLFNTATRESEDCLFINAFAPADPHPSRAVLLFISGGGWQQGNGEIDLSGFAAYEDIVVFTFNYRTNVFEFPNSPDIPASEINLGIYDQQLALEWVQRNTRAFGGDPDKVTIWGESAGAMSVDLHVNRHTSAFRAAMMFSGQMSVGYLGSTARHHDTSYWDNLATVVGCQGPDQLQCMRDVPADDLINAMGTTGSAFLPITDNVTIPSDRAERWRNGDIARVPVLMGTVAEEGRGLINRNISLKTFFGAYLSEPLVNTTQQRQILDAYHPVKTDFDTAAAIYTDFVWQCPQAILANISASVNPTWRFYFNSSVTSLLDAKYSWLGKFHGSDVLLLFSSPTFDAMSPQLYTFAEYFRGAVGRFVRNPQAGPGWPVGYVANLGDVGQTQTSGSSIIDQTALDQRCSLYEPIYPLIEEYVLSV
ncbi:triacylglycerol lipase V precursor [Fusarium phyllophilum]|uniref:Carboxylic ester hydrolase n=1 Tax=Fusarium phyllophilum TaxID=47803 RepID=A0A8H5MI52_9HYPO|nr:triacylglycerol lipase V precursor [Fusarium phyllophilum]